MRKGNGKEEAENERMETRRELKKITSREG